jgi:hypothetical protein
MSNSFAAAYRAAQQLTGGARPIEAGVLADLADHECRHGRFPGDGSPACGCRPEGSADVDAVPAGSGEAA